MKLIIESDNLNDYLAEIPPVIQFSTPQIQEKIKEIEAQTNSPFERAKMAFEIARDQVRHSFDTKDPTVTVNAEDALCGKNGICFAKAHVLATLLRGMGIPAGFCYQRVTRKGTVKSGYALHGLNAVYLEDFGWFRIDPRGNKPGINSQFTAEKEQLAYVIHEDLGEIDYLNVFANPLDSVITAMRNSKNTQELFYKRPETI